MNRLVGALLSLRNGVPFAYSLLAAASESNRFDCELNVRDLSSTVDSAGMQWNSHFQSGHLV